MEEAIEIELKEEDLNPIHEDGFGIPNDEEILIEE